MLGKYGLADKKQRSRDDRLVQIYKNSDLYHSKCL